MNNKQWMELATLIKAEYQKEVVGLHEPTFNHKEVEYVTDCVKSGWVSSVGSYVNRFEEELARFVGVKRAVAVVNGTAALHISLKLVGVVEEDEVLIPSLTFVATANAVTYIRAIPHFVDVNRDSLGIDPMKLEGYLDSIGEFRQGELYNKNTNRRIKAMVPMHTFGHPCMMDELVSVCEKFNLELVEDAAESLGSYYKEKHTGSFGRVSAVSFNGNKIITTGGGGAILTDDETLADYAKHLTTTAKVPHQWMYLHDEIGFNYRMPNLNAALGCAQLEKLPSFIESKRKLTETYSLWLEEIEGVRLFKEIPMARSNYWLQTMLIEDENHKEEILEFLNGQGIMCRPVWSPLHTLKIYQSCPRSDLSETEYLNAVIISMPSTPLSEVSTVES
jgi:perosamine synthetase